ncbi:hypothetical protein [Roseobacter sp. HKCCA0434]|uniref:hypothetical protein n=1 Tax=Roseobacter sp. HKCCA0434 TaxID=3079297 RepID=UPI0029058557|nr:hypothetical protein [Roseobacter sp. HKCCA0434]
MRGALLTLALGLSLSGAGWSQTGIERQDLPRMADQSLGLLAPRTTRLPADLWRGAETGTLVEGIEKIRGTGTPSARILFERLMLAEAQAPEEGSGDLLAARIDALLRLGSLDAAEAMLQTAPTDLPDPDVARLALDVAALTNRSGPACARIRDNPELAPSLAHRIWCDARHGRWMVAMLTLEAGGALEQFEPNRFDHLLWFLDSEMFEPTTELPFPEPMTTLDFALRESTGQARPAGPLPLAWLDADLSGTRTLRARMEAAEALTRGGTLPPSVLFAAYRAGEPAASGGIWGRADAVQSLDAALVGGDLYEVVDAVHALDAELAPLGLRAAAAREYGARLGAIPVGEADDLMARWLLLDNRSAAARAWMPDPAPMTDLVALAIQTRPAVPVENRRFMRDGDWRARAIHDAFIDPADAPFEDGTAGLALLEALAVLDAGTTVEADDLRRALVTLRRAGQERLARAIAVETMFLGDV